MDEQTTQHVCVHVYNPQPIIITASPNGTLPLLRTALDAGSDQKHVVSYEIMKTNPHVSQVNSAREPFYFPSDTTDTFLDPTQPNVVPVLDYQDLPDGPIIVMPYYEKGSLEEFSYVSEEQCVKVLLDLLSCLRYLHGRGVVHRDVKLANLLVDDAFNIVIADFGLSKQSPMLTTFCGTPMFVAPQVFPGVLPPTTWFTQCPAIPR